jgi:hypothetical protein
MGLLDFLKNKPADAPTPSATPTPAAPAAQPAAGPRYQGSKYTAPPEPEVPAAPVYSAPMPPPMPFEPQNVLEQLLLLAVTEEQARPAFYQALLQEEILMILAPKEGQEFGEVVITEGQEIQLQILSDGKLPIFTSPARLTDGGQDAPVSYVRVPGHAFFSMVQGQDCVLNPFSPAGKPLPKEEIAALLAGQLTNAPAPAGGDAQVMLSQPADYPTALVEALKAWCTAQGHISAAYLAQMQMAHEPEVPRLLLAFETSSPDPAFMQELGPVLQGQTAQFQFVDLMILDKNSEEGVNPYFRTVEPFYTA